MATYTYRQFRKVLRNLGFRLVRSKKHESWVRNLKDGTTLRDRVSHQKGKDIPTKLFHKMLIQAEIDENTFKENLR